MHSSTFLIDGLRLALLALALLAAVSCRSSGDPRAVVHGVARAKDGVEIAYDMRGSGEPTLVFVHCWGGNRAFWRDQLDEFARDHRVVALDLAGHGESQRVLRAKPTLEAMSGDVIAVMDAERLERVVLVGHSMGGPIALMVAARAPGRVAGIVAVDTLHDVDSVMPREVMESFAQGFEKDFHAMMGIAIRGMLPEGVDPAVAGWIVTEANRADHRAVIAILRDFPELDLKSLLSSARVPIRCINSPPHAPGTPVTTIEKNRRFADFDAVILDGVGHYPMLEKPVEFNRMLRETLEHLRSGDARR